MSNVITDFEVWCDANEPEDQQELEDLIQSVETATTVGNYATEKKGGQLFVSCGGGGLLRLANDKAKAQFLLYVRKIKVPDDLDVDFRRAIEDTKS
jgi:hypothetical protein